MAAQDSGSLHARIRQYERRDRRSTTPSQPFCIPGCHSSVLAGYPLLHNLEASSNAAVFKPQQQPSGPIDGLMGEIMAPAREAFVAKETLTMFKTTPSGGFCPSITTDSYSGAYIIGESSIQPVSVQSAIQGSAWWVTNVAEVCLLLREDMVLVPAECPCICKFP